MKCGFYMGIFHISFPLKNAFPKTPPGILMGAVANQLRKFASWGHL
jgi:hypothetical protein